MNATIKIALDAASQRHKDANGYLHIDSSHITKEQVVGYYGYELGGSREGIDPDRIYYAYRPAEELIKAAETFNGIPILFEHHDESAYAPCKEYRVGSTGTDAVFNAPYLDNSLHITDGAAIAAIENGDFRELSCAYTLVDDWTEGEFDGQHYDFIQRNIKGNHVALVSEGRAGHDVRVADSAAASNKTADEPPEEECFMGKLEELLSKLLAVVAGEAEKPTGDEETPGAEQVPSEAEGSTPPTDTASEHKEAMDDLDKMLEAIGNKNLANGIKELIEKKYAIKSAPEASDEETPKEQTADEDGEAATAEVEKKAAADTAALVKKIAALTEARVRADMAAKYAAAQDCAPLVGLVDPLKFDSAEAIYKVALDAKGVNTNKHPASAYKSMVEMLKHAEAPALPKYMDAKDSKATDSRFDGILANLKDIRRD